MKRKIIGVTVGTPISIAKIVHDLKPDIKEYIDEQLGDVETGKKRVSGETLVINDISSTPQDVAVRLQSDTINDFSAVSVFTSGKNIFNLSNFTTDTSYVSVVVNSDGSVTATNTNQLANKSMSWHIDVPRNTKLTLSVPDNAMTFSIYRINDDGSQASLAFQIKSDNAVRTKTFNTRDYSKVRVDTTIAKAPSSEEATTVTFSGLQLEIGEEATEFEKPFVQVYTASADGSVIGVQSVSPTMTIFTNTSGVVINAEYIAEFVVEQVEQMIAASEDNMRAELAEEVEQLRAELTVSTGLKSKVAGYKMAVIGDSISAGVSSVILSDGSAVPAQSGNNNLVTIGRAWWQQVRDRYGIGDVINNAKTGAAYSKDGSTKDENGNIINRRFTTYLNETDLPTDLDIIMVFGGTNDWSQSFPLGTTEDEPSVENGATFCGAVRVVLEYLTSHYMDKQIIVVTPLQRYKSDAFNPANTGGKYMRDFVNALKTICADYGVTCIDLYSNSKFHMNDLVFRNTYVPDGTHPNAEGTDRYVENGIFPALDKLWLYREVDTN